MTLSHTLIIIYQTTSHLKRFRRKFLRESSICSSKLGIGEQWRDHAEKSKMKEDRNPHENNVLVVGYVIFRSAKFDMG